MAIKHYIITIDESAMTDALRAQLEALGAEVQEVVIEELDLPEDKAKVIVKRIGEFEQGRDFKSWEAFEQEVTAFRKKRRANA